MSGKKPLEGKVALVAGASRGPGRGIARMLGEAGAAVYCTARTSRKAPGPTGRPETVEETAEFVTAAGGEGIPVQVDHADDKAVAALFQHIARERKRLDVVVLVLAAAEVEDWGPVWKQSLEKGRAFMEAWLWPHLSTAHAAAKVMAKQGSGLIVEITDGDSIGYRGPFFSDVTRTALARIAYGLAEELAPKGVTALAVTPGFMRTETALEELQATEANWREVAETNPMAKRFLFSASETPCFVGRAIAALAADPGVGEKSGGLYSSWGLSEEYGFADVDGRRPYWGRDLAKYAKEHPFGGPRTGFQWVVQALSPNAATE